jgi:CubicO group peptidase (beta-lactamase class C family)
VLEDDHVTTHTTIEDALSHRSGLPSHDLAYGEPDDTPSTVAKRIRYLHMTAEPRTTFQYCNIMYAVVTDLLETLTGLKLETLLREKFWKPLGMLSTSFSDANSRGNLARGYFWDFTKDDASTPGSSSSNSPYVSEPYINISSITGAGATISSVNDYALWVKAYLDVGNATKATNFSSPINPTLYRDVLTPRTIVQLPPDISAPDFITPQLYALGWTTFSLGSHTVVAHGGGLPGFGTLVLFLPNDGYGIVTMGNTAVTSNIVGNLIALVLLERKLGLSVEESASAKATLLAALSGPDMNQHARYSGNGDPITEQPFDHPDATRTEWPPAEVAKLPLPGDIGDYAGLYTHPAYGVLNFTVSTSDTALGESISSYLYGIPTPKRIWRYALELHHVTDTLFTCASMIPHGMGSEVIWEHVTNSLAIFKFGLTGEEVETLGIELEGEMVEAARRKGGKYWKEGMIWFEKILSSTKAQ